MPRKPAEISQESAAHIAKCRMQEMLKDPAMPMMKRMGMQMGINSGADEIAEILYDMGVRLSIDLNDPAHAQWVKDESVILES